MRCWINLRDLFDHVGAQSLDHDPFLSLMCPVVGRIPLPMKARRLREKDLSYAVIGKRLKISNSNTFNACKAA